MLVENAPERRRAAQSTLVNAMSTIATSELYLNNAFRIAGLPVDATSADVRRRRQEIRAVQRLGGAPVTRGPLPLAAEPEAVEHALARLRDPLIRLVDEFFWFWPDDGLDLLSAGDGGAAERTWERNSGPVAVHNLAILNHAIALDDERDPAPRRVVGAPRRWRQAYRYWAAAWRADGVWALFAERVRRLDHPGLGEWTVDAFRENLPLTLAMVNAAIAADGLERGLDQERVTVHWNMVGHQEFPPGVRAQATQAATEPIVDRIRGYCDRAKTLTKADPASGPAVAQRLYDQTAPLLRIVEAAKAADTDGIHDLVAEQLSGSGLAHYGATKDWAKTLPALVLAAKTARGGGAGGRLRGNVTAVRTILAAEGTLEEQRARREREDAEKRRLAEIAASRSEAEERRLAMRARALAEYERKRRLAEGDA